MSAPRPRRATMSASPRLPSAERSAGPRPRSARTSRVVGWLLVAALVATGVLLRPATAPRGFAARLLGPFTSLAASVQLVRSDQALRAGRPNEGYALAESALALDAAATDAWSHLAHHLVFERGSPASEPDPARRLVWIREGLATLRRGAELAREPDVLDLQRGLALLVIAADAEVDLPWPGGPAAARVAAREAFERSAAAGNALAADLLRGPVEEPLDAEPTHRHDHEHDRDR